MHQTSLRVAVLLCLTFSVSALTSKFALAQDGSSDPLVLHPGDTITWQPVDDHRAMFGDADNVPLSQVLALLEIDATICKPDAPPCDTEATPNFTATVRKVVDLTALGDKARFDFTCGAHPSMMDTKMFTVAANPDGAPERKLVIVSKGFAWFIKSPDGNEANDIPINLKP